MPRILVVNDVHLADKPPSVRTDTYVEDILAKLDWCVKYAIEHELDAVVQAGDLFHIKTPSRNSHRLVQRTCEVLVNPLLDAGIPILIVPGNHDMQNDRLDSLKDAPLGVLAHAGAELLIGPSVRWPHLPVFGIPFLQDWADLPRWMDQYGEWLVEHHELRPDTTPLLVTHAPIMPPKIEAIYEYISADDWASHLRSPSAVVYGHIHESHGIYPVHPHWFSNPGALARGSLHETDLSRSIRVTLATLDVPAGSDTPLLQLLDVPHKPASEVYRLSEVETANKQELRLGEFLAKVGNTTLATTSVEAIIDHIRTLDASEDTKRVAVNIIEEVSSS